jgi:hypothetical protein
MNVIRIRQKIESETLHLPQVRPMIGHDVEIIIVDRAQVAGASNGDSPSLDEVAAAQGNRPVRRLEELLGGWPEDQRDDDFEQAREQWRAESIVPEFREP